MGSVCVCGCVCVGGWVSGVIICSGSVCARVWGWGCDVSGGVWVDACSERGCSVCSVRFSVSCLRLAVSCCVSPLLPLPGCGLACATRQSLWLSQ